MPRLATTPTAARVSPRTPAPSFFRSGGTPHLSSEEVASGVRASSITPGFGHSLAALSISPAAPIQCARPPRNNYELPKAVKAGLKGRSDKAKIETHFINLQMHYDKMKFIVTRSERLAAENTKKGNAKLATKHTKAAKAAKAKMTEAIGEMNATNKILRDRPHWRLLSGFSAGVGIDQIWHSPTSKKISVVEAKGPGAKLGTSDRKGKQMSLPWVLGTVAGMKNDFGIAKAIKAKKPKVRGYVITSTATGKTAKKNWDKLTYN